MTTALYRRYRPETFAEMIGQAQVTEPLMTALRGDRVGHAYLFSGPRGCGKTTSARILARCLNCAAGPTDTPCGTCDSCIELGRGGGGSLDVVEIDAASHNGVDDARDLRERAIFAPARDRFKIFILDEAHMVTPQGFNALLKLVEEPPDHVKFIFATTEPEKVIGTIRSRTHHYPFRLVPPAAMLSYVEELCAHEGVQVEAGVLPLVVRAGGGSPRDTLSLLDQLIAGSDAEDGSVTVRYERAVALLGYTHAELLDDVVDAFGARDAAAALAAIDRVVQNGQDPRRFVDDLLERLRDLIVVAATGPAAGAVLRGVSADDLANMARQAGAFGATRLSQTADLVVATLDEMTGATSPRLQLELLVARVLAAGAVAAEPAVAAPQPVAERAKRDDTPAPPVAEQPREAPEHERAEPKPAELTLTTLADAWPDVLTRLEAISRGSWLVVANARVVDVTKKSGAAVVALEFRSPADETKFKPQPLGSGAFLDVRQAIEDVFGVQVKFLTRLADPPRQSGLGDRATTAPAPAPDPTPAAPRAPQGSARPASAAPVTEWAVAPIPTAGEPTASEPAAPGVAQFAVDDEPEDAAPAPASVRTTTLAPAREGEVLPADEVEPSIALDDAGDAEAEATASIDAPVPPVVAPRLPTASMRADGVQRYGEAVVRQVLGATFVREEPYEPPTRFS